MNVSKIGYQPSFKAKFIKNEDLMQLTTEEIKSGRQDALCKALDNLNTTHTNVRLMLKKDQGNYVVRNLYNNNTVLWSEKRDSAEEIMKLSNPFSDNYYMLFVKGKNPIDERKASRIASKVASAYYAENIPDYSIGKIVDASF